jgi:hypothetical protein
MTLADAPALVPLPPGMTRGGDFDAARLPRLFMPLPVGCGTAAAMR